MRKCAIEVFVTFEARRHFEDGTLYQAAAARAKHSSKEFLTCAYCKLSLNSPLSRKGAVASSSLFTCVMIEEDGWSMRSVKPVKSTLKKVFRIKIFPLATIELKKERKKKKTSLQMPPEIQKTFTA